MHHEHLPVHIVADHLEGLLGPGEAAEADRHLAACAECVGIREDLALVRMALAEDRPGPMPAHVVARIDAALDAAAADRASEDLVRKPAARPSRARDGSARLPAADAGRSGSRPGSRSRRRRWLPALATAVAAVAVAVGAAAIYPQLTNGGQSDSATSAGGIALSDRASPPELDTAGEAGEGGDSGSLAEGGAAGSPRVVSSGRQYTAYTLSAGVRDLLAENRTGSSLAPSAGDQPAPDTGGGTVPDLTTGGGDRGELSTRLSRLHARFSQQAELNACIRSIAGRDVFPILVDIALYGDRPAAVIVLPDLADATNALVYVVPESCGTSSYTATLAETTVRRPVTASPSPAPLQSPSGTGSSSPGTPATPATP
jgi:hypothetical protein